MAERIISSKYNNSELAATPGVALAMKGTKTKMHFFMVLNFTQI
jgi:hypothetical protein